MNDRHGILDSIFGAFVPIHPDGYKFVAAAAVGTLLLFLVIPPLGWLGAIATAYCAYFFRDPERVTPSRKGLVVSAAEGKVAAVADVAAPNELALGGETLRRISVFLSIFDVHIVRAPVAGRIVRSHYVPGAFLNAELDKAARPQGIDQPERERHMRHPAIGFDQPHRPGQHDGPQQSLLE